MCNCQTWCEYTDIITNKMTHRDAAAQLY